MHLRPPGVYGKAQTFLHTSRRGGSGGWRSWGARRSWAGIRRNQLTDALRLPPGQPLRTAADPKNRASGSGRLLTSQDAVLARRYGMPTLDPQTPDGGADKPNVEILIADDDSVSRLMLAKQLTSWGYEVIAVADGAQAWRVLQKPGAPQLAILDWMMPG